MNSYTILQDMIYVRLQGLLRGLNFSSLVLLRKEMNDLSLRGYEEELQLPAFQNLKDHLTNFLTSEISRKMKEKNLQNCKVKLRYSNADFLKSTYVKVLENMVAQNTPLTKKVIRLAMDDVVSTICQDSMNSYVFNQPVQEGIQQQIPVVPPVQPQSAPPPISAQLTSTATDQKDQKEDDGKEEGGSTNGDGSDDDGTSDVSSEEEEESPNEEEEESTESEEEEKKKKKKHRSHKKKSKKHRH